MTEGARTGGRDALPIRPRAPTADEADRLANACDTPTEQLIVWTLLDTGLRVGELCDLDTKDVLWQQRQLRVRGKGGPYGKKSKVRVVPMSRRVRALLEHHFALREEFPVRKRRAQGLVKEVANRAGLTRDVTPHVLRHTFAATALQKGISLATVQKILGHDRLQTTAIYLNFTDTHIQEEFERKWSRRGCLLMPGQLFSDAERRRLGGFPAQVSHEDLVTYYTLTRSDRAKVNQYPDDAGRLGFALQLGTLRYLGFCPDDLGAAPGEVVRFLAEQLKVPPEGLSAYGRRAQTRTDHFLAVQGHLGYRKAGPEERERLARWLLDRALEHDRPLLLWQLACEKLAADKLVRPGVTVLERMVVAARRGAGRETMKRLAAVLDGPGRAPGPPAHP